MMRKSILALIIVISVLMLYTGCDGGGYGGGDGGGSPVPGTEGCTTNCPCDFFSVPMTDGCWVTDSDEPAFGQFPKPGMSSGFESCNLLTAGEDGAGIVLWTLDYWGYGDQTGCSTSGLGSPSCQAPELYQGPLTQDQIADCSICLEEYATALNDAGITATGGPPYTCIPDDAGFGFWDY